MTQPAYQRIADDLRRQIVDGHLQPGDKIPSRHQLAAQYGVSDRVTVTAVRLLVSEGYLEARSGSGTYVRQSPQVQRLMRSWYQQGQAGSPFRADMARQGKAGSWRATSEPNTASPAVAEQLGLDTGADVMETRYTFLADDRPVMLSTSWEPLDLTRGTPVMMPEAGPHAGAGVVGRMAVIGQQITSVEEIVTARAILAAEAELLNEPLGSIVMVIKRTYATADRRVETADIVVPTDRYELAYVTPVE